MPGGVCGLKKLPRRGSGIGSRIPEKCARSQQKRSTGRPPKLCREKRYCGQFHRRSSSITAGGRVNGKSGAKRYHHDRCKVLRKRLVIRKFRKRAASYARDQTKRVCEVFRPTTTPRMIDIGNMVGTAQETNIAHEQRHPRSQLDKWAQVCPRCCFAKYMRNAKRVPDWCSPKPSFMSGTWGVGCIRCAAGGSSNLVKKLRLKHSSDNRESGRCKQRISRASVWSRYAHRACPNVKRLKLSIERHACSDMHRLCSKVFTSSRAQLDHIEESLRIKPLSHMQPRADTEIKGSKPLRAASEDTKVGSVTDPFRGNVPQCRDWLSVWGEYTEALSTPS